MMLEEELWSYAKDDDRLVQTKSKRSKPWERRGAVKRILMNAIDKSSMGSFGERMYFFGGRLYEPIDKLTFRKVLYDIIDQRLRMPDGDMVHLQDTYFDCENAVFSKKLDVSNSVMVFKNGVLDVERNEFHKKFDKRFVQVASVDYEYIANARTFLWKQFLDQVLPDKQMQDVLQMFLGATFIDRKKVKLEKILILLGPGANGKSVVQGVVKGVLGEDYVSEQSIGKLCTSGRDGELAAAAIAGKRLNYCTEMDTTDFHRQTARIKALVSGERIVASRKFIDPYYVTSIPLLMANANQLPVFNANDNAMLRRLYVVPFKIVIPEERQNRSLGSELEEEYPGILNWILEGRKKFIENKYNLPVEKEPDHVTVNEQADYNNVIYFMQKRMKYHPKLNNVTMAVQKWVLLKSLYESYCRWCMANEMDPFNRRIFSDTLVDCGYIKSRSRNGVAFGVYGGANMEARRRKTETEIARLHQRDPSEYKLTVDGKLYILGSANFSIYAGVGHNKIYQLTKDGIFNEHIKNIRNKRAYEADACIEMLRNLNVISKDDKKDAMRRFSSELSRERRAFNQWNEMNGFPYRKYKDSNEQIGEGIIVVEDDTTRDEVIAMARKAGYDVTNVVRFAKCRKENRDSKD